MSEATRPFVRGRFEDLPALPPRAHRYWENPERRIIVPSSAFGAVGISYRELGQGPPLLLVHGLMTTGYSFRYIIDALAQDYRVIVPDLPGCGRSDKPPGARYTAPALASFLVELVDALGIRGCRVVGNSMGGYLCMRAALADHGAFGRLIDVHSPGAPDWRYVVMSNLLGLGAVRAGLAWVIQRSPKRWVHRNVHYYNESLKSLEEAAEYGDPLADRDGVRAFVGYLRDTFAPRELERFATELRQRRDSGLGFPIPLTLLYSREDPLVPPAVGRFLHELVPDAPLVWLDRTSHFAHVDTPEAVVTELRRLLRPDSR